MFKKKRRQKCKKKIKGEVRHVKNQIKREVDVYKKRKADMF